LEELIKGIWSVREKNPFFLDGFKTVIDGLEAIKMKKSLIVIGSLLSSSKVYFVFRFLFFSTFPFFSIPMPQIFQTEEILGPTGTKL
jgi:hypothetical protein